MSGDFTGWTLDPDDPRASSQEQRGLLSPAEQARVIAALPALAELERLREP